MERLKNLFRTLSIFFMDKDGALSMTRLCTFILVVGGLVFAFIYPLDHVGYIGIISLGLGGKITQKYIENGKEDIMGADRSIND